MIQRFLCWLLGHRHFTDVFTGQTTTVTDRLTGNDITVPVTKPMRNELCPRCAKRLIP